MFTASIIFFFSSGTFFRRQNLTSTDVRFWRLKAVPALVERVYKLLFYMRFLWPSVRTPMRIDGKSRSLSHTLTWLLDIIASYMCSYIWCVVFSPSLSCFLLFRPATWPPDKVSFIGHAQLAVSKTADEWGDYKCTKTRMYLKTIDMLYEIRW